MLSYALSTGTQLATSYFHLPFDDEEDEAIKNYERKYLTWVSASSSSDENKSRNSSRAESPSTSSPPSPSSSRGCISSSSSSASLNSLASSNTSEFSDYSDSKSGFPDTESQPSSPVTSSPTSPTWKTEHDDTMISSVIQDNNLYSILGVPNLPTLDKMTLRRAYLSRSKACHPDKFPRNPLATEAFQKVAVAYDVLSTPALRRRYDERTSTSQYDVFAARPTNYAEETLRTVVLGVLNDFLDGDLEVIRSLLTAINDFNPGMKLGEEGINSILSTLHSIRERALTCRVCIYTLHTELTRLLEAQHAFSQLSYFDILGRTRLTVQLTRITVGIPLALERALNENKNRISSNAHGRARRRNGLGPHPDSSKEPHKTVLPRHALLLIRGIDVALKQMERILQ
ncbi:DnaJ-domain-containing protein [Coprinopsis marcescibilis]|uniref:DnaJ-domain-containing protein n=1 Tax=Coprinopsis marcescibilis TaxID=230819 RepID=A0A5C3KLA0_COPMA|nr:DnaJ-domain-containing protein [Coprinopsis marcescibilis]